MHDALREGVLERPAALEADLQHVLDRQQLVGLDELREVAARDDLHGDIARVLLDHRVEDGDDVRVPELPGERGLVQELRAVHGAEFRVAEYLGLDRLQRHLVARERVLGEVHRPRRAFAEQLLHVVFPDLQAQIEREFPRHAGEFIRLKHLLTKTPPRHGTPALFSASKEWS